MATNPKLKAMSDAAFARWSAKNPGKTRADYTAYARQATAARAASYKAAGGASKSPKPSTSKSASPKPSSASYGGSSADAGYARYAAKNPGATRSDYSAYAKQRVKDMAEQGYQRYVSKNPGASRADYSAHAKQRVKDFAARSRSRKLSG